MPQSKITVDFGEIFNYAEEKFDVHWNKCCDIFHRGGILCSPESSNMEIDLDTIKSNLKWDEENPDRKYVYSEDKKLAYRILISFMEKHNLEEMYVIND